MGWSDGRSDTKTDGRAVGRSLLQRFRYEEESKGKKLDQRTDGRSDAFFHIDKYHKKSKDSNYGPTDRPTDAMQQPSIMKFR